MKNCIKKIISIFMIFVVTFYSLFGTYLIVIAEEDEDEYYLAKVTSDVNVRSLPTTDKNEDGSSNKIGEFNDGVTIKVVKGDLIEGNGCKEGWVKAIKDDLEGYVCSRYVVDLTIDAYDRPWTTPKKAIVGGAKFISRSYISKGQFTSYLKKFNVNPDAYADMFNHQYMASLHAPSSEAITSYSTYSKNGLLEMPLEFSIPVFLNMEDKYDRPGKNLAEIVAQDEVTDEEFEKILDEQEFPESYKRILRALHIDHENWVFKAMHTNVDFNEAVLSEKDVSSIQGGNIYYDLSSGSAIQTEPGWYIANNETVAYYLDPRNFLTEKYILQFESLQYSENYTESIVQNVLQGTFMAEYSLIDNQTYASIFVEAGKETNVSPVYLASLARLESGVNGGLTTKGEEFVYDGVTYSGLFNFFNIGAYSSAANPAKAGLVYASGGYCTTCTTDFVIQVPTENPDEPSEEPEEPKYNVEEVISYLGLKLKDGNLVGIEPGTKAADLLKKDDTLKISQELIGTGTVIEFKDGTKYTVVIYGDLSGDGIINTIDALRLKKHILGVSSLSNEYLRAAQLNDDGIINTIDALRLKKHILGISLINQE